MVTMMVTTTIDNPLIEGIVRACEKIYDRSVSLAIERPINGPPRLSEQAKAAAPFSVYIKAGTGIDHVNLLGATGDTLRDALAELVRRIRSHAKDKLREQKR